VGPYGEGRVATYHPVADLLRWLGGDPFIQIGRHAAVNLQAIDHIIHHGGRFTVMQLRDRGAPKSRPRAQGLPGSPQC